VLSRECGTLRPQPIGQCTPAGPARSSCGPKAPLVGRPPTVGLATMPHPACVREEAGDNPLNNMQLAGSARPDALAHAGCCRGACCAMAPTEHLGERQACRRYPRKPARAATGRHVNPGALGSSSSPAELASGSSEERSSARSKPPRGPRLERGFRLFKTKIGLSFTASATRLGERRD
jgi:hypothetical protein